MIAANGLDLFCDTLTHLHAIEEPYARPIDFVITGFGDLHRVRALKSALVSDWLRIEVYEEVARADYFNLLASCHASLSLRIPSAEYSNTTFPSKVIEITSHGIGLVSTLVSDVGEIFDDNSAWLLSNVNEQTLTETFLTMANNPTEVRSRARAGFSIAQARFAPLEVGRALSGFLYE